MATQSESTAAPTRPTSESSVEAAQHRAFEAYSLAPVSRRVAVDSLGIDVHVFDVGESRGDDPPLLMLHGGGGFSATLAPMMAELDGRRLLAIDRPGYGLSGDFRYTTANNRDAAVAVIDRVLDGLEIDQVDLLGNSGGGYWAIAYALQRPERVNRLVLVGSVPTLPGTRAPVPLRLFTIGPFTRLLARLQPPSESAVHQQFAAFGEGETIRDHPAVVQAIVAQHRTDRSTAVDTSEFAALLRLRGWQPSSRLTEHELSRLEAPTLFIWGGRDPLGSPAAIDGTIAAMPDATLEVIDEGGHLPWLGAAGRCAALVGAFLDGETR